MNVRDVYRKTKPILIKEIKEKLGELNRRDIQGNIDRDKVIEIASEYISNFDPIVKNIEEFALSAISEGLPLGSDTIIRFAGDLISISEKRVDGKSIRFAQGAPALIGWRLLILSGALAIELEDFDSAAVIMNEPIEIEESSGLFSHQSLVKRRRLFYPEAFLGYANYPMHYIATYWNDHDYLHEYFAELETYQISVAKILLIIALATSVNLPENKDRHLYPGYRLIPEVRKAMSSLCGRMASSDKYLNGIAEVIGDTGENLKETWDQRATSLNEAELGEMYFNRVQFPIPMSGKVEDW